MTGVIGVLINISYLNSVFGRFQFSQKATKFTLKFALRPNQTNIWNNWRGRVTLIWFTDRYGLFVNLLTPNQVILYYSGFELFGSSTIYAPYYVRMYPVLSYYAPPITISPYWDSDGFFLCLPNFRFFLCLPNLFLCHMNQSFHCRRGKAHLFNNV